MAQIGRLLIVILVAFLAQNTLSFAGDADEHDILAKEKKLGEVKKQLKQEKRSARAMARKEASVLGELEGINKELSVKKAEILEAEKKVLSAQRESEKAGARLKVLASESEALSGRLNARLKAMYKLRRGSGLQALFSAVSLEDLGRRHKYMTAIAEADAKLLSDYAHSMERLKVQKETLASMEARAGEAKKELIAIRARMEELQRDKTEFLGFVRSEKEAKEALVKELEEAQRELGALIEGLRESGRGAAEETQRVPDTGFSSMKGRLPLPIEGRVVSRYGSVKHPKFNTVTFNNGIIIEAELGAPVKSVYGGKVAYTGWLRGYGQVMIIDHGGGYYTLFAYLQKTLKEKGDSVKSNEEVALVGDTGSHGSAALYFEVRQRGVPRDPSAWLAKR